MSLEVIMGVARKHLKQHKAKHLRHLARQISLVDSGVRMGFICGPPQPPIENLRSLLRQLHLDKVISDGCTCIAFHGELCIVNLPKIHRVFHSNLPIFVDVSQSRVQPQILEHSNPQIVRFLNEFREKMANIEENCLEFSSKVSLSAVLGLLGGFPVVYWSQSDGNCLSMCLLRQFRASIDKEEVMSFTVPEILMGCPEILQSLNFWKSNLRTAEITIEETVHQELVVIL